MSMDSLSAIQFSIIDIYLSFFLIMETLMLSTVTILTSNSISAAVPSNSFIINQPLSASNTLFS